MSDKETAVRLSLLDVLYGVVLGYGFSYFDKANSYNDYFRFIFAYAIIITDWIYVHRFYWKKRYTYNSLLFIDIGVIFSISRVIATSTAESDFYILWLSILFFQYTLWDLFSKRKEIDSIYDWRYSMVGDISVSIGYAALWLVKSNVFVTNLLIVNSGILGLFIIAYVSWSVKKSDPILLSS